MSEDILKSQRESHASFALDRCAINWKDALVELRSESSSARARQRKRALFHRGPLTQSLFLFEPAGGLPDHLAPGWVTIEAVEGQLTVVVAGEPHELKAGMVIVVAPGTYHSVWAAAETGGAMLLTVFLERNIESSTRSTMITLLEAA